MRQKFRSTFFTALSVLSGTTIADQNTVIAGSSSVGLDRPQEIITDEPVSGSILVADGNKNQVVRLSDGSSSSNNNSVVVSNWTNGNQLQNPFDMYLDINRGNNLYVSDSGANRVVMFTGMNSVTPPPRIVAGNVTAGAGANLLNAPRGIAIDRQGNMIIADYGNHRVMLYGPNVTFGTIIAGSGTAGNNSLSLYYPTSLFLDERNSWLFIADTFNHRIQRFSLNKSLPLNGTTVAGGNGLGSGSHQLNYPFGIWVSNKTGVIYIADSMNHRIQRWIPEATSGVTIAGDPNGNSGTNATMLTNPYRLTTNKNESMLYVSDSANSRIQRFQLI